VANAVLRVARAVMVVLETMAVLKGDCEVALRIGLVARLR
jgi:hypothetical protein